MKEKNLYYNNFKNEQISQHFNIIEKLQYGIFFSRKLNFKRT